MKNRKHSASVIFAARAPYTQTTAIAFKQHPLQFKWLNDFYHPSWVTTCFIALLCVTVLTPAIAQESQINNSANIILTDEENNKLKISLRDKLRENRKEEAISLGNRYSVMATANCIEGYVQNATVNKSTPDVEIISQQGVVCDAGGCQGWQVEAKRESDALFDLDIRLTCSQEDWSVIEKKGQR